MTPPKLSIEWRCLFAALLDRADALLFPRVCGYCGETFEAGLSNVLCQDCLDQTPRYETPVCWHCGLGLAPGAFEGDARPCCRDCGEGPYALDACYAFGPYEGALRLAHHAFKFEGMEHLATVLGQRMAGCLPSTQRLEVLTPVPTRPERERERGYHPARLLAMEVSRRTNLPLEDCLEKGRATRPQVELDRAHRLKNLRGAFHYMGPDPAPSRVLLVDDVYTTGGTLEACAVALKGAGVGWVGALVLGRTPRLNARNGLEPDAK